LNGDGHENTRIPEIYARPISELIKSGRSDAALANAIRRVLDDIEQSRDNLAAHQSSAMQPQADRPKAGRPETG
jgi:FXSXX-COOH protein